MLFSVICIITHHALCDHLSITVDPNGEDGDNCLQGHQPCRSIEYPARHLVEDYSITISTGNFITGTGVTISNATNGELVGAGKTTIVKGPETNVNAVFLVEKSLRMQFSEILIHMDECGAFVIQDSCNGVTFRNIYLDYTFILPVWQSPFIIVDSNNINITPPPTVELAVPPFDFSNPHYSFYIEATNVDSLTIDGANRTEQTATTFISSELGLIAAQEVSNLIVKSVEVKGTIGNTITAAKCNSVTVQNLNWNNHHLFLSEKNLTNSLDTEEEEMERLKAMEGAAKRLTLLTQLAHRTARSLSSSLFSVSSVRAVPLLANTLPFRPAAIVVQGGQTLSIESCTIAYRSSGGLDINEMKAINVNKCVFTKNTLSFLPPFLSRSVIPKASFSATPSSASFSGSGASVTLRDIHGTISFTECTFRSNSVVPTATFHSPSARASVSRLYQTSLLMQISRVKSNVGRTINVGDSETPPSPPELGHRGMNVVGSDVWLADVNHLTINAEFIDEEMSYDSEFLRDEEARKAHFAVPVFATSAPITGNLLHSNTPRPSACLFLDGCTNTVELKQTNAKGIQGSVFVLLRAGGVQMNTVTISDITTQANVFCESAIYIRGPSEFANVNVQLEGLTGTNICPSPLSNEAVTGTVWEDSGWAVPTGGRTGQSGKRACGGLVSVEGVSEVSLCRVGASEVVSNGDGGAVFIGEVNEVSVRESTFERCKARGGSGGAVAIVNYRIYRIGFDQVVMKECRAAGRGGGLYYPLVKEARDAILYMGNITATECVAGEGGGLFAGQRPNDPERIVDGHAEMNGKLPGFCVSVVNSSFQGCVACIGGGFVVGSQKHNTSLLIQETVVKECSSRMMGGGGVIDTAVLIVENSGVRKELLEREMKSLEEEKELDIDASCIYLTISESSFEDNDAALIGGGLFVRVLPIKQNSTASSSSSVVADDATLPSLYFNNLVFRRNKCGGTSAASTRMLFGGGGLAERVARLNGQSGDVPVVGYNTLMNGCEFDENIGGGFLAFERVLAVVRNTVFKANRVMERGTGKYLREINVECVKSKLNLEGTNKYYNKAGKEGSEYSNVYCDLECESFKTTVGKCLAPPPADPKPQEKLKITTIAYPTLPQLSLSPVPNIILNRPLIMVSTGETPQAPMDEELITQMLRSSSSSTRWVSLSKNSPLAQEQARAFGNGSLGIIEVPNTRSFWHTRDGEVADPVQMFAATAVLDANNADFANVTTVMEKLTLVGFPKAAPKRLFLFGTTDGTHWSKAVAVEIVKVLTEDERKNIGYYAMLVMSSFIVFWILIVTLLHYVGLCAKRRTVNDYAKI